MKIQIPSEPRGIALIMVMIIVVVFGMLAAGFAYSMKVEIQLARNSNRDTEMEWMGRSGIELAKYVLASSANKGVDSLKDKWAGGPGDTNDPASAVQMENRPLGSGTITVKITDCNSKININNINPANVEILRQALILIGVDAAETPKICNGILDWLDPDDSTQIGSTETESDYYLTLNPPYRAKDGPIDDLTELLLIHYITPAMYWGSHSEGAQYHQRPGMTPRGQRWEMPSYPVGFVDLFTPFGAGGMNINTAPPNVLQLIPEVDGIIAQAIIAFRNGPDGVPGTEDDVPLNIGMLASIPGIPPMPPQAMQNFSRLSGSRSTAFEVKVDVQIDQVTRTYYSVLARGVGRDLQPLFMYWKDGKN